MYVCIYIYHRTGRIYIYIYHHTARIYICIYKYTHRTAVLLEYIYILPCCQYIYHRAVEYIYIYHRAVEYNLDLSFRHQQLISICDCSFSFFFFLFFLKITGSKGVSAAARTTRALSTGSRQRECGAGGQVH